LLSIKFRAFAGKIGRGAERDHADVGFNDAGKGETIESIDYLRRAVSELI
jgi:hypothetical protein